jgi:aminopeptidase N
MAEDRKAVIEFSKKRTTPVVDSSSGGNYMQLLNANSYQKGGWVLHMLRRKLGDSLFWKGIQSYYTQYAGKNASTNDFRKAMEASSGQDLQLFFKQWLFTAGQPVISSTWKYNSGNRTITFTIKQKQAIPFEFPLQVAMQSATDTTLGIVNVKGKISTTTIPCPAKPENVVIDPNIDMLFEEEKK